jgi:ketosteroid isomerase-like protein
MYGRLITLLAMLCAALALCSCQQSAGACPKPADTAAEAARVRGVIDDFFSAAKKRDWDAAGALMSPDFELYSDEAQSVNKDEYVRALKQDDLVVEHMELKDVDIRVSGDGQMAWAKYRGVYRNTSHGTPADVETVETLIFTNERGTWKMARAHASIKALDERRGTGAARGPERLPSAR